MKANTKQKKKTAVLELPAQISIEQLAEQAQRATRIVAEIRSRMLAPDARKTSPMFSKEKLQTLCGLTPDKIKYRLGKGDLPVGTPRATGNRREFSLGEMRTWAKAYGVAPVRPEGAKACVITCGNSKGGVSKTTTVMTLAQGLALRGLSVLAIDLDPQGSLTTLFGYLPEAEIDDGHTVAPLCHGDETGLNYAVRKTYWEGVDLIPASPTLFSAEFALPARQSRDHKFAFWDVLNVGLDSVRDSYDVIVIDTAPALSYLSINAFFAADGMIVPMPPNGLDFASSAQFWNLFADLAGSISRSRHIEKSYDFIHVLLSKVDMSDSASSVVRDWIVAAYGSKVLPVEIPKTAVSSSSGAEFGTVYDVERYEGNAKTYARAKDAYDRFVEIVEQSVSQCWARQAANIAGG